MLDRNNNDVGEATMQEKPWCRSSCNDVREAEMQDCVEATKEKKKIENNLNQVSTRDA